MNKGFCFIAALYTQSLFVWFWFLYRTLRVSPHSALFLSHNFLIPTRLFPLRFGWFSFGPEDSLSLSLLYTSTQPLSVLCIYIRMYTVFLIHFILFFSFLSVISFISSSPRRSFLLLSSPLIFTLISVCWLKCFQYQYFIYICYTCIKHKRPKHIPVTNLVIGAPFQTELFNWKRKRERKKMT